MENHPVETELPTNPALWAEYFDIPTAGRVPPGIKEEGWQVKEAEDIFPVESKKKVRKSGHIKEQIENGNLRREIAEKDAEIQRLKERLEKMGKDLENLSGDAGWRVQIEKGLVEGF